MNKLMKFGALAIALVFASSCSKMIEKAIENNPEIVFNAIKKEPKKFFDTVSAAQGEARKQAQAEMEQKAEKEMDEEFGPNPKKPAIDEARAIAGNKEAKVTIVEYSDFLCPHCSDAANKMDDLLKQYDGKVRVLYKHLPYKKHSEPASRYYEAIALKDKAKAKKFHDYVFQQQREVYSQGVPLLDKLVKKAGANLAQVKKDMNSEVVNARLKSDMEEATKFGINGTPGFIINGVSVKGNYPKEHFVKIIDRHLGK